MRVILLSEMSRVHQHVIDTLPDLRKGRVVIIDSASGKPKPGDVRGGTAVKAYTEAGAQVEVLDLLEDGAVDISDATVVHFTGGDPFRLLKAIRQTDFDKAMETRMADETFAVVGSSAGAMVLGRDIAHAGILCDASQVADTTGLGWIDGLVMPHLDAKGAAADKIRSFVDEHPNMDWLLLNDGDVQVRQVVAEAEAQPGW